MTKTVRVNVRTAINSSGIRRERRDGRDYIIVPSATLPDNVVMNRIRYPADEIAKGFASLENTPAPLGHPNVEGVFVSASDPEGLARGWIGAWNRNVRRENGRVFVDKVIDVATARQLEGGKAVLDAIEQGEPIHTSTGLIAILEPLENDAEADWAAKDMAFDHDAILLGEEGAATPEQGVGMLVNKAVGLDGKEIEVINSVLDDEIERDLNWGIDQVLRAVERERKAPLYDKLKSVIRKTVFGDTSPDEVTNAEEESMDKAQFDELSGEVKSLTEAMAGIDDKIAAAVTNGLKPLTDQLAADKAERDAKAEAEKTELVNKVVKAGLLDEETAKAADIAVLNALAEKAEPGKATLVNGAYKPSGDKPGFKLPEGD